jgi:hypothetical protein
LSSEKNAQKGHTWDASAIDTAIKPTKIAQTIVHIAIVMLDQRTLFGIICFNRLSSPPVPGLLVVGNKVSTETLIFGGEPVKKVELDYRYTSLTTRNLFSMLFPFRASWDNCQVYP